MSTESTPDTLILMSYDLEAMSSGAILGSGRVLFWVLRYPRVLFWVLLYPFCWSGLRYPLLLVLV